MRTSCLLAILFSAASLPASAQPTNRELARVGEAVAAIHSKVLTDRHTYRLLGGLCKAAPSRLSGSPWAAAAVEWGRQAMLRCGLENVHLEEVVVPHWVRGDVESLKIVGLGEALPILALGGSVATPKGGVTAEVLQVTSIEELKARAAEAKGKIVFFNRPFDAAQPNPFKAYGGAVNQRTQGPGEAAKLGAVATVVRSMTSYLDDVPHTGGTRYTPEGPNVPCAAVSTRGAERIAALLAAGPVRLHLELSCEWLPDATSHNVVGELRGRELPDEVVLVGGHLDAWDVSEGAHDCGAGCCQSIEALHVLKQLGLRPRRTLRVVLFMNEENGLAGGRQYEVAHRAELGKHLLALESDRGGFSPRGFSTNANPRARAVLEPIAALLRPWGGDRVVTGYGGADISPLAPHGVIQVGYLPDPHRYFKYHHTAIDTLDKVSWRELELGTAAMASLIYGVAEIEQPIPRNPPERSR